jgi:hypothetical protein
MTPVCTRVCKHAPYVLHVGRQSPIIATSVPPHKCHRGGVFANIRLYVTARIRVSSLVMHAILFKICLFILNVLVLCTVSLAADFRVDNRVYSGDSKDPVSLSCTIFHQAVVYDFMQNPAETIIFDKASGRIVILDDTRQIRTQLSTSELDDFTRKLKDRAVKRQDSLMQFLAEPIFEERYDSARRELILFSDLVNYRAITASAENAAVAAQYREFSDWSARLNAYLIPGARPPFARMKLNEALAKREAIAREVTLTITVLQDGKRQPATVRSEHLLSATLAPTDMQRIEHARKSMTSYKLVSFDKYRQAK